MGTSASTAESLVGELTHGGIAGEDDHGEDQEPKVQRAVRSHGNGSSHGTGQALKNAHLYNSELY